MRGSPIRRYRYELGTHQTQALQTDCNHSHPAGRCEVSAAAAGSMPLWAALLGLFASVVLLNAVCGILLGAPSRTAETVLPASHNRPAVQLQVVRGGHAA